MVPNTRSSDDVIVMTRSGYEKLKEELIHLRSTGRTEIARQLEEARGFGDLSENAEYQAAKDEQAKLESRVQWLEYQLSKAKVIDTEDIDSSKVTLGTKVRFVDLDSRREFAYTIVGSEESDPKTFKLSAASPVGQALMGREVGEEVLARVPKGTRKLRIVDISVGL
ncbi:MAG: transcription elongation factor GreA [Synergistales bacterium]|jgi:transcription elongation factor GreA|nr:transcription elongation factor GreA [Synergistales bacterium]